MNFYKRVEIVCNRIPHGNTASYGQIALLCGKPKNARQVGYALNHGLAGKHAPAHRVVNRQGILSGASSFQTYDLQKRLLEQEGVTVQPVPGGWQVDLKRFGWKNTMREAEALQEEFLRLGI